MKELIFYHCPHCGNIAVKTNDSGAPISCCGQPMQPLVPHTAEAGAEKHLPAVSRSCKISSQNCSLTARIGTAPHPMADDHHINWICLQTDRGFHLQHLAPGAQPQAEFCCGSAKPLAVYAYCNIHGLWRHDCR